MYGPRVNTELESIKGKLERADAVGDAVTPAEAAILETFKPLDEEGKKMLRILQGAQKQLSLHS